MLIIAEAGHNHNGKMNIAKELIHRAKDCGADIVKFQLYDTAKILPKNHQWYWDLERSQLTKEQWLELVFECNKVGIEFLASAFDVERVEWCKEANMARYKIASRSIYDEELLEAVVKTGKDMIMSLGMVDPKRGIPQCQFAHIDYLYCIAKYPTPLSDLHFDSVDFNWYAGFSDHTIGIEAAMAAIVKGARIIEKHFTLDKNMDGCDHKGSAEPKELKALVSFARSYEEMQ